MTRIWAERGSRPRAPRDQRYDWAYLFGAVCPARDAGAALVLPVADGETMNLHLAEISRNVTPGSHAVVLLDGAGWHQTGGKLKVPDNISLLKLPAYSPNSIRSRTSGNTCARTSSATASSTATMPSSTPAAMLGMHSPLNRAASNQLRPAPGHRLLFNAVGIITKLSCSITVTPMASMPGTSVLLFRRWMDRNLSTVSCAS